MDHSEEIPAEFFEASCQPPHILDGAEEALDDVAHFIESDVMGDRLSGVALRRNDGERTIIGNELADSPRAVGFVSDDSERRYGDFEKVRHNRTVMDLTTGDDKAPGTAMFIDYSVNFACAATA